MVWSEWRSFQMGMGGAVVRMIIVMEVRKTSSVIVEPIRYEEPVAALCQRVASLLLGSRL